FALTPSKPRVPSPVTVAMAFVFWRWLTAPDGRRKEASMSITDQLLQNNQKYVEQFNLGHLPLPPARKLAVLACMDARLTVEQFLGLKTGDAHIIRNAGGIATEDALRSLIISHHLLGTVEFIIVNHTDCGMLTFRDHELLAKLERENGGAFVAP